MLEKKVSSDEMKLLFGEIEEEEEEEAPVPETPPSDEEIDIEEETEEIEKNIRPHNWSQKRRLTPEQMRTLRQIHELFAQNYQLDLANIMGVQARITPNEPRQESYDEFVKSLPNPTYLNKLALPPLDGIAALQIDLDLALAIIDRNLGGASLVVSEEEIRPLSEIEQRVIQHLLQSLLTCLRNSWDDIIGGIQPTFTTASSIPFFLSLALPEDIVIVLDFDVSLISETGAGLLESKIRLCYPYMSLQPIISLLRESRLYEVGRGAAPRQEIKLDQVQVPVICNLVREPISVEKLLNLKVGDGIKFDVELSQASEVVVGETRMFWGKPGISGRKRAVKVESIIKEDIERIPIIDEAPILPKKVDKESEEIPEDL